MFDETLTPDTPDLFEGMTAISAVLDESIRDFNDRRVVSVFVDKTRMDKKAREIAFLNRRASELGFTVTPVHPDDLDNLTSGKTHGGIVAVCSDRTLPLLSESMDKIKEGGFYVLLEGIEDPYNFGYTVRSLYAAGADGVILPPRNWMSAAGVVCRASAGASEQMKLFVAEATDAADLFHEKGYRVIAADLADSTPMWESDLSLPLLLIVGGERRGISRERVEQPVAISGFYQEIGLYSAGRNFHLYTIPKKCAGYTDKSCNFYKKVVYFTCLRQFA